MIETAINRRRTIILIHNCDDKMLQNVFPSHQDARRIEEKPIFMCFVRPNDIQITSIRACDVFEQRRKLFVNNQIERQFLLQKARMGINMNHDISLV